MSSNRKTVSLRIEGEDMETLIDTVAIVTGASAGIGRATARELLGAGAYVVLGARRRERLEAIEAEFPGRVAAVVADVRSPDDCRRLVNTAIERFGRLDSLIANAGIGMYGDPRPYRRGARDDA